MRTTENSSNKKSNDGDMRLSSFTLVQQLSLEYWDDDYHDALIEYDIEAIGRTIYDRLSKNEVPVESLYIVLHDKDVDERTGKPSADHIHALITLKNRARRLRNYLADTIGLFNEKKLQPFGTGGYSHDNELAYLIHAKTPSKYLYKSDKVFTIHGKDYLLIYSEKHNSWDRIWRKRKRKRELDKERARGEIVVSPDVIEDGEYHDVTVVPHSQVDYTKVPDEEVIQLILQGILNDEDFRTNYTLLAKAVKNPKLYKRAFGDIEESLEFLYGERPAFREYHKLFQDESLPFYQLVVSGRSRTGKTKFADNLVKEFSNVSRELTGLGWNSFNCCNEGDVFDGYNGEESTVIDDIRGNFMSASQFYSLGNNRKDQMKSRYGNVIYKSRINIVTTNLTDKLLYESIDDVAKSERGTMGRISYFLKIEKELEELKEINLRDLGTIDFVQLFTYDKDLASVLVESNKDSYELDFDFLDEVSIPGLKLFCCSEMLSFEKLLIIMSNLVKKQIMIPVIENPKNVPLLNEVRRQLQLDDNRKLPEPNQLDPIEEM